MDPKRFATKFGHRLLPITGSLVVLTAVLGLVWLVLDFSRRGDLNIQALGWTCLIPVAVALAAGSCGIYVMARATQRTWIFLSTYTVSDTMIGVRGLLRRPPEALEFHEVTYVKHFFILGQSLKDKISNGRTLCTADGRQVDICEALPIWNDVQQRCSGATFQPAVLRGLRKEL